MQTLNDIGVRHRYFNPGPTLNPARPPSEFRSSSREEGLTFWSQARTQESATVKKYQELDEDYDRKTDHGRSQGATLL